MGVLFGGGKQKTPKIEPAPPPPQIDDAREGIDTIDSLRRRRGVAASNIVREETAVPTAKRAVTGN